MLCSFLITCSVLSKTSYGLSFEYMGAAQTITSTHFSAGARWLAGNRLNRSEAVVLSFERSAMREFVLPQAHLVDFLYPTNAQPTLFYETWPSNQSNNSLHLLFLNKKFKKARSCVIFQGHNGLQTTIQGVVQKNDWYRFWGHVQFNHSETTHPFISEKLHPTVGACGKHYPVWYGLASGQINQLAWIGHQLFMIGKTANKSYFERINLKEIHTNTTHDRWFFPPDFNPSALTAHGAYPVLWADGTPYLFQTNLTSAFLEPIYCLYDHRRNSSSKLSNLIYASDSKGFYWGMHKGNHSILGVFFPKKNKTRFWQMPYPANYVIKAISYFYRKKAYQGNLRYWFTGDTPQSVTPYGWARMSWDAPKSSCIGPQTIHLGQPRCPHLDTMTLSKDTHTYQLLKKGIALQDAGDRPHFISSVTAYIETCKKKKRARPRRQSPDKKKFWTRAKSITFLVAAALILSTAVVACSYMAYAKKQTARKRKSKQRLVALHVKSKAVSNRSTGKESARRKRN